MLLGSAVLEAVWATALGLSGNLTILLPTLVFAVTATLSMVGLGLAIRCIPLGTAYSVWVGIGAALTVGWAMATGNESFSVLRLFFIVGIVACAAGLKALPALAHDKSPTHTIRRIVPGYPSSEMSAPRVTDGEETRRPV
ncbi:DMT family transporter [Arthrobacter sp. PsM3]|uniref:DMT family transporter n=1 Tax=Arthrobacter sp. PsM3 TaxID=3030531 RepID=UPI00263BE172|nr:SMR family transporter [Arthrobacter sp. PsM3]MDN4645084.1 SMR family transporter [Arthrobacter sp. PsM3]